MLLSGTGVVSAQLAYIWALIKNKVPVSNIHCHHFVFLLILPADYIATRLIILDYFTLFYCAINVCVCVRARARACVCSPTLLL